MDPIHCKWKKSLWSSNKQLEFDKTSNEHKTVKPLEPLVVQRQERLHVGAIVAQIQGHEPPLFFLVVLKRLF